MFPKIQDNSICSNDFLIDLVTISIYRLVALDISIENDGWSACNVCFHIFVETALHRSKIPIDSRSIQAAFDLYVSLGSYSIQQCYSLRS
ncbi:hypothetical protein Plhal304r1_c076g0163811 [Plasmopara halstedii]